MEAEETYPEQLYRLWAWIEDNLRQVLVVGSLVLIVGIVVAYFVWQGGQKQIKAAESLSVLLTQAPSPGADQLLDFSRTHSGTAAAKRASFLAAGRLFAAEKYDEAQEQFQAFLAENPGSPFTSEARLGVAACMEAQGNTDGAVAEYQSIVNGATEDGAVPIARFALGLIYEERGETELARAQYQALANSGGQNPLGAEARARLADLPVPEVAGTNSVTSSVLTNSDAAQPTQP